MAKVNELYGDLHLAKNELAAARSAYDKALAADVPPGDRQMLEIKRDALAVTSEPVEESSPDV